MFISLNIVILLAIDILLYIKDIKLYIFIVFLVLLLIQFI